MKRDKSNWANSLTTEEIILFIRDNSAMFYQFASRYIKNQNDIEDILQECCMRLWLNREKINISTSATSYVFTMIRNIAYDRRKKMLNNLIEFKDVESTLFSDEDMFRNIIEAESSEIIAEAIRKLSPMSQKVMYCLLDGKTNKEIAKELQVSINTLKTIKYRAIEKLSKLLPKNLFIALSYFLLNT